MSNKKKYFFLLRIITKKIFFYNFRNNRRSICISRWNGVIVFRDRRIDICDEDNDEDGWISIGLGDASSDSIRLGLLLNNTSTFRYMQQDIKSIRFKIDSNSNSR